MQVCLLIHAFTLLHCVFIYAQLLLFSFIGNMLFYQHENTKKYNYFQNCNKYALEDTHYIFQNRAMPRMHFHAS